MKYGMDRAGNRLPIALYAWGSGQSALYSYIMIPFLLLEGLTVYTMRLPMALIGIASLYIIYYLLKNIFDNKKIALVGVAFLAICPWHIMKSRWGMECNIFPDLVLLACLLLVLGLKKKNTILQVLSFIVLGLSSYSYGTAYLFLPFFVIITLVYLVRKREISLKRAIAYLGIVAIVSLPMIIYVMINTFGLKQIDIGITIPTLKTVRYKEVSTVFQDNIILNCLINISDLVKLLVFQNDGLPWNALPQYGMFYLISIIFFAVGIVCGVKEHGKNKYSQIMNIWMLSSIILAIFLKNNINRINIIMIPCAYYIILGLYFIMRQHKALLICIAIIYTISFGLFIKDYISQDSNEYSTFASGIEEVVEFCENSNVQNVYCIPFNNEPFIYFLFYGEYDVNQYINTVQYKSENGTFGNIKSFSKYNFYLPTKIDANSLVIFPKGEYIDYGLEVKNKVTINQFDIYEY